MSISAGDKFYFQETPGLTKEPVGSAPDIRSQSDADDPYQFRRGFRVYHNGDRGPDLPWRTSWWKAISNRRRSASARHKWDYDEDYGYYKQHMSDPWCFSSNTTETERFGYQSHYQKNNRVS
jgi:hypothetical protein